MTSTSSSASTSTQNGSTSSVQGATNNDNNNGINDPVAKLAASRGMLAEDTRHKLEGIVKQLDEKTTNSKF